MGERRVYAFPLAFAAYPAFFLASQFPLNAGADELAVVVLVFATMAAAIYAATYGALRRRAAPTVIALVAAAAIAFLFCAQMAADRVSFVRQRVTLAIVAALLVAGAAWLVRRRKPARTVARAVGAFAWVLLLNAAVQYWVARGRVDRVGARAAAQLGFDAPIPLAAGGAASRPDIYLFIIDGLANEATLEAFKGGANRGMVDSLRALGFAVPTVWSNYPWTAQSVSAMLNAGMVNGVRKEMPRGVSQDGVYFRLVQSSRVAHTLADAGYRIYLEPPTGFGGSRRLDAPHKRLGPRGLDVFRAPFGMNAVGGAATYVTVWGRLLAVRGRTLESPEVQMRQFAAARRALDEPGPKFVLLHTLLTHDPFMLDGACKARPSQAPPDSQASAYVEHVHCAARELLPLVTEILRRAPRPPVILIQGDHGAWPEGFTTDRPAASLTEAELIERYGAFGAYYLPDGGARDLPPVMSPVNVLRFVLDRYLGAHLPLLPNQAYYAPRDSLIAFAPVDTMRFIQFHDRWAGTVRPEVASESDSAGVRARPAGRPVARRAGGGAQPDAEVHAQSP